MYLYVAESQLWPQSAMLSSFELLPADGWLDRARAAIWLLVAPVVGPLHSWQSTLSAGSN